MKKKVEILVEVTLPCLLAATEKLLFYKGITKDELCLNDAKRLRACAAVIELFFVDASETQAESETP